MRTHEPFDEVEFRRQWLADIGIRTIGAHFGRSRQWVCKHARRLGLPVRATDTTRVPWGKIRHAYVQHGLGIAEIVAQLQPAFPNLARATVRRYLQRAGVKLRGRRGLARPDEVLRLRRLGFEYPEIAARLKLTKTQVGHVCRRVLGSGPRGKLSKVQVEKLVALRRAGRSLREIAAAVGLRSQGTVCYHLRRAARQGVA